MSFRPEASAFIFFIRRFLASQRNWVPQGEMQESPVETLPKVARVGRMRVEGGVIDVQVR